MFFDRRDIESRREKMFFRAHIFLVEISCIGSVALSHQVLANKDDVCQTSCFDFGYVSFLGGHDSFGFEKVDTLRLWMSVSHFSNRSHCEKNIAIFRHDRFLEFVHIVSATEKIRRHVRSRMGPSGFLFWSEWW